MCRSTHLYASSEAASTEQGLLSKAANSQSSPTPRNTSRDC